MDEKVKAYQTTDTLGKSQLDLIIKVYDGAMTAYKQAGVAFEKEDFSKGREELDKAKKFVTHLYTTLDMEKGGDIAQQLSQLYAFVVNQTNIIDATKDLKQIDDIIGILDNLRQGWVELKQQGVEKPQTNKQETHPQQETATFTTSA